MLNSNMNSGLYVYSIALTIVSGEFKKAVQHDDIFAAISAPGYVNFRKELDLAKNIIINFAYS